MCVIDNISIRYDQMQGRFLVLFTVTDVVDHRSNFVLIVSKYSQFTKCPTPPTGSCPSISPLFSPATIAPIVGGNQTGGIATVNWYYYTFPINLTYLVQPTTLGNGVAGTATTVTTGGQAGIPFVSTAFCPGGGPNVPLTVGVGGTERSCTNYFPTAARMGLDNDNITLIAPVLDQDQDGCTAAGCNNTPEGSLPTFSGTGANSAAFTLGPYAGTRVVTVPKLDIYNGLGVPTVQPPTCDPATCGAVNLSDNVVTGTLTELGTTCSAPSPTPTTNLSATTTPALAACEAAVVARVLTQPVPAIFWEPANLRGRALGSFDAQVAPLANGGVAGVITPIEYLVGHRVFTTGTQVASNSATIWLQPVVFSCPSVAIAGGVGSVPYCGVVAAGQVPDQPVLGPAQNNISTIAGVVSNPLPVGQGLSATQLIANDGTQEANNRLFVGDSRPLQVMFREGLLYEARSVEPFDSSSNALGTSTVLYDLIRTCATNAATPTCPFYSADGTALVKSATAQEYSWFNGQAVPTPTGNVAGFGFYAPMFESPADVVTSGPLSPISVESWLEKLFVGMTTGGTANLAGTFSKDFPSLWDFRPGDDAYDTVEPYINAYTGVIQTTVICPNSISGVTGTVTSGSKVITSVTDTTGVSVGMFVTGTGIPTGTTIVSFTPSGGGVLGTITLSAAATATNNAVSLTFSTTPPSVTATASLLTGGSQTITLSGTIPAGIQLNAVVTGGTAKVTTGVLPGAAGCPALAGIVGGNAVVTELDRQPSPASIRPLTTSRSARS